MSLVIAIWLSMSTLRFTRPATVGVGFATNALCVDEEYGRLQPTVASAATARAERAVLRANRRVMTVSEYLLDGVCIRGWCGSSIELAGFGIDVWEWCGLWGVVVCSDSLCIG